MENQIYTNEMFLTVYGKKKSHEKKRNITLQMWVNSIRTGQSSCKAKIAKYQYEDDEQEKRDLLDWWIDTIVWPLEHFIYFKVDRDCNPYLLEKDKVFLFNRGIDWGWDVVVKANGVTQQNMHRAYKNIAAALKIEEFVSVTNIEDRQYNTLMYDNNDLNVNYDSYVFYIKENGDIIYSTAEKVLKSVTPMEDTVTPVTPIDEESVTPVTPMEDTVTPMEEDTVTPVTPIDEESVTPVTPMEDTVTPDWPEAKEKLYNILINWDFEKYGLISVRNIFNNYPISNKSVTRYSKYFRGLINNLNEEYNGTK